MNTTEICFQKKVGHLQQGAGIGLFLLSYGSLFFLHGITLSRNATTNLIAIKEEATTNIKQNGKQFQ
jgi:hypothetical protein